MAGVDPSRLVCVDESSPHRGLTRAHGRAPRGVRARGQVPRNRDPRLSLVAALSLDGLSHAALTLPGAIDAAAFTAFAARELVPRLRPGQVVVLDNLSVHTGAAVRQAIEGAGRDVLLLPPYSPDFAPVEQASSKIEAHLRRAGARTRERLEQAISGAFRLVTPADAHGWFRHCGYAVEVGQSL